MPSSSGAVMTWQVRLRAECSRRGVKSPNYQLYSERRGGRTAWTCSVEISGHQFSARYWYGGDHTNNAREDAAEVALQRLGWIVTQPGAYRSG